MLFKYLLSKLELGHEREESLNEYQKMIQSKCSMKNQFLRFSAEEMLEQIREESLNIIIILSKIQYLLSSFF